MSSLFLSTLAMMGLTFLIGFFVAGVIKIIANWADFLEFYNSHREDIRRLHLLSKNAQELSPAMSVAVRVKHPEHPMYKNLLHRINTIIYNRFLGKRIAA